MRLVIDRKSIFKYSLFVMSNRVFLRFAILSIYRVSFKVIFGPFLVHIFLFHVLCFIAAFLLIMIWSKLYANFKIWDTLMSKRLYRHHSASRSKMMRRRRKKKVDLTKTRTRLTCKLTTIHLSLATVYQIPFLVKFIKINLRKRGTFLLIYVVFATVSYQFLYGTEGWVYYQVFTSSSLPRSSLR